MEICCKEAKKLVKNIFKEDNRSKMPFIVIGAVLIVAIIGVTIYGNSKKGKNTPNSDAGSGEKAEINIPEDSPYTLEPVDDLITNENIGDYAETIIEGRDVDYLFSTMDDKYAYFISTESINRMESLAVKDYVATAYEETNGEYSARETIDSVTEGQHYQMFLNVGRTIDGMTSIRWDEGEGAYYSSGNLRIADVAKILVDPDTDKRYKDVYAPKFVGWDHRNAFQDDDQFYVRKLFSSNDGSLMGYVFEQTSIQHVGEEDTAEDQDAQEESQNGTNQ